MKFINYEIGSIDISYTVETINGHIFTHALPKDTPTTHVERYLALISMNLDKQNI